jgi:hypothetical protein
MARKYVCEVCEAPIKEGHEGAIFRASVSFPPKGGFPQPTLRSEADVCSTACLIAYVQNKLLPDIASSHARWATHGVSTKTSVPLSSRFPEAPRSVPQLPPAPPRRK